MRNSRCLTVSHSLLSSSNAQGETTQTTIESMISSTLITKTLITPTPCITITSYTTAFGCVRPTDCPVLFCPVDITTSILPCTCHSPVETVTTTTSCGCAGCGPIYTSILPPTCESSLSCPTVTATAPPQCPPITTAGCITPDCALISTLPIPCGCTGIQTVNECNGKCPTGCETFYTGLGLPCPLTAIEQL
jgi:hypothetical protein